MIINIGLMYKQYVAWNMYKLYTNDALLATWCRYIPRCKTCYGTFQRWFWLITIISRGLWVIAKIKPIIKMTTWLNISHTPSLYMCLLNPNSSFPFRPQAPWALCKLFGTILLLCWPPLHLLVLQLLVSSATAKLGLLGCTFTCCLPL